MKELFDPPQVENHCPAECCSGQYIVKACGDGRLLKSGYDDRPADGH